MLTSYLRRWQMATEESQGMNLDDWERRATADSSTLFEMVNLEEEICRFIMTNPPPPEESRNRLVAVIGLVERKFQSAMTKFQAEITECRKRHEDIVYAIRTAQNRQKSVKTA